MNIQISSVTKKFGKLPALDDVSIDIAPGETMVVLGPNGAGKTTLLRCMAGIAAPDKGQLRYDGERFRRHRLDLRKRFVFLPDVPLLFPDLTPIQHVGMMVQLYEVQRDGIEAAVVEIFQDLDLMTLADSRIGTLSRGQAYKTSLAGLLAVDPEVWLLDEPLASGMDPTGVMALKRRARDASVRGRTIVYSTQMLETAERFSDRFCLLHKGQVRALDSVSNLQQWSTDGNSPLEELFAQLREDNA